MSEQVKKTVVKDPAEKPDFNIGPAQSRGELAANADVEKYLKAKEGVAAKDRADFEIYLNERKQRDSREAAAPLARPGSIAAPS